MYFEKFNDKPSPLPPPPPPARQTRKRQIGEAEETDDAEDGEGGGKGDAKRGANGKPEVEPKPDDRFFRPKVHSIPFSDIDGHLVVGNRAATRHESRKFGNFTTSRYNYRKKKF